MNLVVRTGPLVSVILPVFNGERFVREAINSVLAQTYAPIELIVINDGSTDRTEDICRSYGDRIKYVTQNNVGLSETRNRGIALSNGEFVAFIDADDVWLPEKTAAQAAELLADPRCVLVSCASLFIDEYGRSVPGKNDAQVRKEIDGSALLQGNILGPPSGVTARKNVFHVVNGFDRSLHNGAEDWDLYLSASSLGSILQTGKPLLKYRVVIGSMSSPKNAERMLNNEILVLQKAFASAFSHTPRAAQRRSFAHCYRRAAIAYADIDAMPALRNALLQMTARAPGMLLSSGQIHMVAQAALGRDRLTVLKERLNKFAI